MAVQAEGITVFGGTRHGDDALWRYMAVNGGKWRLMAVRAGTFIYIMFYGDFEKGGKGRYGPVREYSESGTLSDRTNPPRHSTPHEGTPLALHPM